MPLYSYMASSRSIIVRSNMFKLVNSRSRALWSSDRYGTFVSVIRFNSSSRNGIKDSSVLIHSHEKSKKKRDVESVNQNHESDSDGENKSPVVQEGEDKSIRQVKKGFLVPRVKSTDYIPTSHVQMEGLYAGYRPLFLGNSPLRGDRRANALDNFFSSFAALKLSDDAKDSKTISVSDVIEDLKKNNADDKLLNNNGRNRKPIIPWDASISGMVYDDQPFKHVPRNVVSRLRPFKMVKVERKNDNRKNEKNSDMIKMRVHNPEVSDESEIVNLLNLNRSGGCDQLWHSEPRSKRNIGANSRKKYERELSDYAYNHKFIKSDQRIFKTDAEKINRLLSKEFHKQTGLTINSEFTKNVLPLYIYVDKSISSRTLFRRFLKKRIKEHIQPVLMTLLSSYSSKEQANKFQMKVHLKIDNVVRELAQYLPSVYFTGGSVDCILHSSPIVGFRRIHWLKPYKRHGIFWGKNSEIDYFFQLNGDYNITRSGARYMRYPVTLQWKTFETAFSEWDYFG